MELALAIAAIVLAAVALALGVLLARSREREVHTRAQLDLSGQRLADLERVLAGANQMRQELTEAAKAAVVETSQVLSSKLIEDHRRESAEAKKEAEERVRLTAESLVKQVERIATAVTELSGQVQKSDKAIDAVVRSLSSPGGAGQIAEIGLGNTLKAMGLEAGRDYVLQASTIDEAGQRLRPDALVFVPGNSVLVIDCKSSKYLLDIAEAESAEQEAAAYANFALTMNGHLRALAGKDYRGAVQSAWREAGRPGDIARTLSVMYLPNEAALEKLVRADRAFFTKAREVEIIPAGPAGLHCALSLAAAEIMKERQVENQQRIIDAAQSLVDGVTQALIHATAVGKGIRAAADSFQKLTGSVNLRLLPRARKLAQLGVKPDRALPANLPAYSVVSQEADQVIDGEVEEVAPPSPPRLLAE